MPLLLLLLLLTSSAFSQTATNASETGVGDNKPIAQKQWHEKINIRGYAQVRYNRLLESNNKFTSSSTDRSLGDKQGLFLRRARLTFSGEVSDRVFIYIQPDYATEAATASSSNQATPSQNYFQIRDAYFDYNLSLDKEWRIRTGISKVPFGFSNLQSSSNRAPLDRDDALNTGAPNERDTGIFLMYTPSVLKKRFKDLTNKNLKGTGDYGMISVGAYNGQSLNRREENNDLHRALRFTYPFELSNGQFIEASLQGYEGMFEVDGNGRAGGKDYYDQRTAASFIVYPQPLGFQVEYTHGRGPEYDVSSNQIEVLEVKGGYAQLNYQIYHQEQRFFPYVRYQEYAGGRKLEAGAPSSRVREWEMGSEWQPDPAFELTVAYAMADRYLRSAAAKTHEDGQMLRVQAQFNY